MINSIKSNTISEANVEKKLNELNEIKKVEIKGKRLIESQKKLLSLFDDLLKTIFNETVNESNSNTKNESKSDNESDYESDNENKNESVNENKNESKNESENENESDDGQYYLKQLNNNFKEINETKSFKDQINIFKKIPDLGDYWFIEYYEDNKETNLRLFKLKLAHILNDVDDNLFKEIFGFTSVELADKLINTTSKEVNQMLINDIEVNRDIIFEQDKYSKFVIETPCKRGDLLLNLK